MTTSSQQRVVKWKTRKSVLCENFRVYVWKIANKYNQRSRHGIVHSLCSLCHVTTIILLPGKMACRVFSALRHNLCGRKLVRFNSAKSIYNIVAWHLWKIAHCIYWILYSLCVYIYIDHGCKHLRLCEKSSLLRFSCAASEFLSFFQLYSSRNKMTSDGKTTTTARARTVNILCANIIWFSSWQYVFIPSKGNKNEVRSFGLCLVLPWSNQTPTLYFVWLVGWFVGPLVCCLNPIDFWQCTVYTHWTRPTTEGSPNSSCSLLLF